MADTFTVRAKVRDLPSGVGVNKTVNGRGREFWRVRLGKRFTGGVIIKRDFNTLADAREWIFGEAQGKKSQAPSPIRMKLESGAAGFALTPRQLGAAVAAQKRLGEVNAKTDLLEAVEFFIRHTRPEGGQKPLNDAIEELLAAKRKAGKKESYIKGLGWSLRKFAGDFSGASLHEISRDDFEGWLDEEDFSLATRRNYIRDCGILFNFALGKKWMSVSPVEGVEKPEIEDREIVALSIRQAARLLLTARNQPAFRPFLAPVAIQLFAGLRTSEIRSLDWSEVRDKQIIVLASKAKTRQRRTVAIADNLATWLATERKSSGLVAPTGREWRTGFTALTDAAKITPWPRNALRHSFGSYHYALHKNENLTAAEMGNSPQMIFQHYRAVVFDGDEMRYWNLSNREPKIVPMAAAKTDAARRSERKKRAV
jgi:integrase